MRIKFKINYLLPVVVIITLVLIIYNNNHELTATSFDSTELRYAKRFFWAGVIGMILFFLNKKWRSIVSKITLVFFGISLILNLYIFPGIYESVQLNELYAEYSDIETCDEMEKRFLIDLKNEQFIYFQFGIGYDIELAETLEKKYKIKSIGMGCIIDSEMMCYNRLLNHHLKEKYDDRVIDFWSNRQ